MNLSANQLHDQGDYGRPLQTLWPDVVDHAAAMPDKPAVIDENGSVTFSDLVESVIRLSDGLRDRGVRRGDVVGVQLPPIREFVCSFLALSGSAPRFARCCRASKAPPHGSW